MLESTDDILYSCREGTDIRASVPLERPGEGVLFEARKEERQYTWRIVHSGEGDVRPFFDS